MVAGILKTRNLAWLLAFAALSPVATAGLLASPGEPEPICADRSGARGYIGPNIGLIGEAPQPACIRDLLPVGDTAAG